jgi:PAS domain S-box-containing protein
VAFLSKTNDVLITHFIYAFFLAFIIALFSVGGLLKSVKALTEGTIKLRKGQLGISLPVYTNDELGDVTEAFNEMSATIKEYTEELSKKDLYINTMFDPLWVVDTDNIVIDINPSFTNLFGYERAKAIGMHLYDFFDAKNRKIMEEQMKQRDKGISCIYEISIKNVYGVNMPVLLSGAPIIKSGKIAGKVGVFKDFREQKAFRENMANIILDSIPDGVYTVDLKGVITAINDAAAEKLGLSKTAVIGMPCSRVIAHTDNEGNLLCGSNCPMTRTMRENNIIREETYLNIGEKTMPIILTCSPLVESSGKIAGAVQVFRDISKEKEIDRMKTDFVESVSHEFRTPLSAIVGMSEMIMEHDVEEPKTGEYLQTIHSEGIRLSEMVSQLLNISIIEHGQVSPESELLNLTEVINSGIKTFAIEKIIKEKNGSIVFKPENEQFLYVGDKNRLKQLIINLLENSLIYSDDGVNIFISLERSNNDIIITVKDTGWGIPSDDLPNIFKRFYRGRHGKMVKGTGLGLSLCEEIIKLHKGSLAVISELGKGSEFKITLPAKENMN